MCLTEFIHCGVDHPYLRTVAVGDHYAGSLLYQICDYLRCEFCSCFLLWKCGAKCPVPNATTTVFSLIGNTSFLLKIGMKSVTVFSNEYIENDARILYFIIKDLCGKCNRKSSVFRDRKNRLIQSDGLIPTIFEGGDREWFFIYPTPII